MKELKLIVKINKPARQVFEFTVNPANTSYWIDSIVKEESNSDPIVVGTILRNWDAAGKMNEYKVTRYEPYSLFQIEATHQDYKIRYSCRPIFANETEFEYYEWSDSNQLHAPNMQEILEKLKDVMEKHPLHSH